MPNTEEHRTELAPPDPERIRQAIIDDKPIGSTELKRWLAWQQEEIAKLSKERWEYEKGLSEMQGHLSEALNVLEWYGKKIIWIQGRYEGGVFFSQAEDDQGARARTFILKMEGGGYR